MHDQIEDLEAEIESLAATAEGCRKWILLSKVALTIGGILLSASVTGFIRLDLPMALFAIAVVLGGIVLGGVKFQRPASDRSRENGRRKAKDSNDRRG